LPDKPSIAVLPFANMSGDPEQEYFADGMVEEIITALSRIRWLFVIARNSTFTYKGQPIDVKQVGHELGVRYVLEGSVLHVTDQPDSDVDLLVEFSPNATPSFFDLADIEQELSGLLGGRRVDVRTAQDLSRYFRDEVIREAEVQYESA
jgi:predicted nucleotidyltransferase